MVDERWKDDPQMVAIHDLVRQTGTPDESFEGELVAQMIYTCLKIIRDKHTVAQVKLMSRALKEMRYAYGIFNQYTGDTKLISIFGSARTPEDHPDYQMAIDFGAAMAGNGWMCITGAADGIMKAGLEGSKPEAGFGLAIKLAFESGVNTVIEGDPKLINFRYFFTRKLMFVSHSDAVAVFPGGLGTMDELFEVLTLMQTGKSDIIPVVLMAGNDGDYWHSWEEYIKSNLLDKGFISAQDLNLYYKAPSVEDAVKHIEKFYRRYHSSRYVKEVLVIRMKEPLLDKALASINQDFKKILHNGEIVQGEPLPEEGEFLELPRLI